MHCRLVFILMDFNDMMKGRFFAMCLAMASLRAATGAVTILGYVGEGVTLPCVYGEMPPSSVMVAWQRGVTVVHGQRWSGPMLEQQDTAYRNRTSLGRRAFERGTFSLSLGPLAVRDEGCYKCIIIPGGSADVKQIHVQLEIAANSTPPVIEEKAIRPGLVLLSCATDRGYPEPVVNWTHAGGLDVSAPSATEPRRDPITSLWRVSSSTRVSAHAPANYTCTVTNTRSGHTDTVVWRAPGNSDPSSNQRKKSVALIAVPFVAMGLLAVLGLVYRQRKGPQPADIEVIPCEEVPMVGMGKETLLVELKPVSGFPARLPKEG